MMSSSALLFLLLSLQFLAAVRAQANNILPLPLCDAYQDTFGSWHNSSDILRSPARLAQAQRHFLLGDAGPALNFSKVWLPKDCAVHRFTNHSIHSFVQHILAKQSQSQTQAHTRTETVNTQAKSGNHENSKDKPKPLHIYFFGDSATRGVFCGIVRILSGSELYGPCVNQVCGTPGTVPISFKQVLQPVDVDFGPFLKFTFVYIKTLFPSKNQHTDWKLEWAIKSRPYAVVINTGAWDFDHIARSSNGAEASPHCNSNETERVSQERISPHIQSLFREMGGYAKELNVRAIYRTNHYNTRFGVHCADEKIERFLRDEKIPGWEIWDNRRMSEDVWKEQNYDGFHFDRHRVNTRSHHVAHMKYFSDRGWELPGMMEIQFAQSLLFSLFREAVQDFVAEKKKIVDISANWVIEGSQ